MKEAYRTKGSKYLKNIIYMENNNGDPPWKQIIFFKTNNIVLKEIIYKSFESIVPEILMQKKDNITKFEEEHKWEIAKKLANPYEMIYTQEEKFPYPNISLLKPLSRSYFKMIEMLESTNFFKELPKDRNIRSAHVAEGPGGFIQAFIDLSKEHKRRIKIIHAITLKSDKYQIPGWKKANSFLKKYSDIINISYGQDDTGDIYKKENQDHFISTINNKVDLFTSDGGFDFSFDYSQQEKQIFPLIICSFIMGFQVLAVNGLCIIKIFDTYSTPTQTLISLCGSCFKEYSLYKPVTSRACNSERYFIGKKYKGLNTKVLDTIKSIYNSVINNLYPYSEINILEKEYIESISKKYEIKQIECIDLAIEFANNNDLFKLYYNEHLNKCFEFCNAFKIPVKIKQQV
jgi:23S rRNA U2552 (ribose-2'-O)-methylase RlmE/FtsJ